MALCYEVHSASTQKALLLTGSHHYQAALRDGSVAKHMHCSCREPEFSSDYPCLSAHNMLLTLASSDLRPLTSWYLHRPPYTYTELKIIKIFVRHGSACL